MWSPTIKAEATSKQLIYLTFNEKIQDPNTTGGTITVGGLTVQGCFLTADPRVVRVVLTTPQGTGNKYATPNKYTVTVQNIKDLIGNNTALGTQDFDAFTPHGKYAPYPVAPGNGNRICGLCHKTHNATGLKLLNATSIKKFCFVCHGNTGNSVYLVEKEFTSWVSGGVYSTSLHKSLDAADGGNNVLSCVDCHDPHGARRPGTNDLWPKLLVATNVYGVVYNGGNGYCLVCHGQFGNNLTFSTGYGMSAYWISLAGDHLINPQGFS
ncbi:MAG TPA: cytochrome c3 family protein, partial [Bacillota bacterium]|nr:cytochrome c3 family protein [Bacillota bacterium]